jgi:hypothetical protein
VTTRAFWKARIIAVKRWCSQRGEATKTYFLGLALVAFVSAVAIQGLHARTTTPPVYVVVEIDEITDAKGFEALRQADDATAIEVQFEDSRYFARTENVTAIVQVRRSFSLSLLSITSRRQKRLLIA